MIEGKSVLGVTLVRKGSKGIKNKNTATLDGKTLITYTIEETSKSKYIDEYVISTDCPEIKSICDKEGIRCIDRPHHLATDEAKSSDALIHAIESMNEDYDFVVEVMATNPLKTHEDIDGCITCLAHQGCESVVSVVRIYDHHPSRVKFLNAQGIMQDFYPEVPESRRQDLKPEAYVRNGSVYAMTTSFLMREKARYGKDSVAYVMPPERTINIDEPQDLLLCETLIKMNKIYPVDEFQYSVY